MQPWIEALPRDAAVRASTIQNLFRPACFASSFGELLFSCAKKVAKSALKRRRLTWRPSRPGVAS
ncbi:hypothetical protein, partial [Wenzhouxiangella sp. 15190]|uniref:hypothetical protein n=1 Tax=Wenzhouxiangella sp. 15190 TaxID=2301225 RepID=UPI001C6F4854